MLGHKLAICGALALGACQPEVPPSRIHILICQQDGKETYRAEAKWWSYTDGQWWSGFDGPRYRQAISESCRTEVR